MPPSDHTLYIGIDPTLSQTAQPGRPRGKGQRAFFYVAVNLEGDLIALGQGSPEDVLAYIGGQKSACVALTAPRRPNQGLMAKPEIREQLDPPPRPGSWRDYRVVEYNLRCRQIPLTPTPGNEEGCPAWMRSAFDLYSKLETFGYHPYPSADAPLQMLEVNAYASFFALLGHAPFPSQSLEGRLQRQLALYQRDLNIPNPMDFFEEITPHRLLQGELPLKKVYQPGELDALVAAWTARQTALEPEKVEILGDVREGQVVVPRF